VPRGTWVPDKEKPPFRLRDYHPLWLPFPGHSAKTAFCNSSAPLRRSHVESRDTVDTTHANLHVDRFRLFPVRSPLLRESRLMSVPPGTEMVPFPGFASSPYGFR
jgi:hypothetical protein